MPDQQSTRHDLENQTAGWLCASAATEEHMDNDDHLSTEPDEVVTDIAAILAGGCFRYLKSKRLSVTSEPSANAGDIAQVAESELVTENHLDSSSRRTHHS